MSSKAINNSKRTKSKKKLETMGNSTSSKNSIVKGEAKLLSTESEVERKTNGELLMSALKGAKKSATKVMKSFSQASTKNANESLGSKEVEASMILYRISEEHSFLIGKDEKVDNLWTFPVGKLEVGESPEDAAKRGLKEEAGIECNELTFIDKIILTDGKSVTYVTHIFHAIQSDGHPTIGDGELTKMKYATFNVLEEYCSKGQGRKCLDFITCSTVREKVSRIHLILKRSVPGKDAKHITAIPTELTHLKESLEESMTQLQNGIEGMVKRILVGDLVSKVKEETLGMISTLKGELFDELSEMHTFNAETSTKIEIVRNEMGNMFDKLECMHKEAIKNAQVEGSTSDDSDLESESNDDAIDCAKALFVNDDKILSNSWKAVLKYAAGLDSSLQAQLIEKISAGNNDLVSAICFDCDEDVEFVTTNDVMEDKGSEGLSFDEKKAIFETKPITPEELNERKMAIIFKECESVLGKEWSYDGQLDHLTVGGLKIHMKIDEAETPYVFSAKNSAPKKKVSFFAVLESKEYIECQFHSSPDNHEILSFVSTAFTTYIEEFNKANVVAV